MDRKMLRDDQWERLEGLLPGKATIVALPPRQSALRRGRVMGHAYWQSMARSAGGTVTLAPDLCPLFALAREGCLERVATALRGDADMEHLFIDSTIVRAHQHSAGAQKSRRTGNRSLVGGLTTVACGSRCLGQPASDHSLGRSTPYRTTTALIGRSVRRIHLADKVTTRTLS